METNNSPKIVVTNDALIYECIKDVEMHKTNEIAFIKNKRYILEYEEKVNPLSMRSFMSSEIDPKHYVDADFLFEYFKLVK
jgi:hypothetical protein